MSTHSTLHVIDRPRGRALAAGAALALVLGPQSVSAQATPLVWENATEFSFVTTSGNASSNTLGLNSSLNGENDVSVFKLVVGGIRSESNFTDRTAVANGGGFDVTEVQRTERSAAKYFAQSRFDRNLGENDFFAFGGAGWERNTFAGFNNRFSFVAGIGDAWINDDVTLFKTDIGGTYTIQKDVDPDPTKAEGFGGLRATLEFTRAINSTTDFATNVVADENLANTDDLRIDWVTSLSVALSEGLAFRTSYQLLFDNDPALLGVPVLDAPNGTPTGATTPVPSNGVDGFLTVSLVIKL